MLRHLSKPEFLDLAQTHQRVAVFQEILADRLTPISIFEIFAEEMQDGVLLESGMQRTDSGHYSFLAFDKIGQLQAKNNVSIQTVDGKDTRSNEHPLQLLRKLTKQLHCSSREDMLDFIGGAVGFMTYDAVRLFENIPERHDEDANLPDLLFSFYNTTLVFDHQQQTLIISVITDINNNPEQAYQLALQKIESIISRLQTSQTFASTKNNHENSTPIETDISDTDFMAMIEQAKKYITRGDAFQIVTSRCFKQRYTTTPLSIYRVLRRVSAAPYMFYLSLPDRVILGASPEKLIGVQDGILTINPIAGTRKRSDKTIDEELAKELLSDKKEIAEHMMLVDLARNDVGAVCEPGSVTVNKLMEVKHFSHVSHITSMVTGTMRKDKDIFDALAAAFPAGTLSGAPKVRAMEIINELETSRRGIYGGAICRLDFQGNIDSCIAIRMAVLKDGVATVRAGCGVVFDSDPLAEANETRHKAQTVLDAITLAERGYV